MAKNTSILLGDHFDSFIQEQVQSGRFSSASEVVRSALRLFELEERKRIELIQELEIGEKSGFIGKVDAETLLKNIHKKHLPRDV